MELLQSARGQDEVQGRDDLKRAIASDLLGKEVSKPSDVNRALLSIEDSEEAEKARKERKEAEALKRLKQSSACKLAIP